MNIIDFFKGLFSKGEDKPIYPKYGMGVVPNDEDYRQIDLPSVQPQLGGILPTKKVIPQFVLDLDVLDQGQQPACVTHAIAGLLMAYIYRKFGKKVQLSPRFAYKLCKLLDGLPNTPGTKPRVAALVFTKFGCCTLQTLANDVTLTADEYLAVNLLQSLYDDASANKLPGFAAVPLTLQGVKDAIIQNDIITGSTSVGDWSVLPLTPLPSNGWHYTEWCGFEQEASGKTRVYIKNQWSKGWLAWLKNWIYPGYGYFLWEDYVAAGAVADIIAFTDIPKEYLDYVKAAPYKFTYGMSLGNTDPGVRELQKMLNGSVDTIVALEGSGSPGQETNFFGGATKAALIKWQQKNHIDPIGLFGPLSMKTANLRIPKMLIEQAIVLQESGGNDQAIGDKNLTDHAYGPMQIRQPAVDDVNKATGTAYKAQDCLGNRALSITIFDAYMKIYNAQTDEEKARLWNGGPNWRNQWKTKPDGTKYLATDGYWSSVKNKLNT